MVGRRKGTGLLAGRDGWLFWIGTHRQDLRLYGDNASSRLLLWRWRRLILARAEHCRREGYRYVQVIVPDKLSVYDSKLVGGEVDPDMAIGRRLQRQIANAGWPDTCIDLFGPFRDRRGERELYLRTDTHFTPAGYRLCYAVVSTACGAAPARHVLDGPVSRDERDTDLGSKLRPPARELCDIDGYEHRAQRVDANELVRHREQQLALVPGISGGSRIVYRNDLPGIDPRRIVVFGDSYTFHDTGLGPMLAESFREVHLVWSSPLDFDLIRHIKPDLLIHEIAERFLRRVPRDGVSIEALAQARLASAIAEHGERRS